MIDIKTKVQDSTINFQDIEYYGSRSTPNIRKLKSKNGTSGDIYPTSEI